MTVRFSDEEYEWIITDLFNWHIKEGCPDHLRKKIEEKFALLDWFYEETNIPMTKRNRRIEDIR